MQVVLANKLARKDSSTNRDVWYKTIVDGVLLRKDKVTNADGAEVNMGCAYTILFPFTGKYVPYHEWIKADRENTYTMSQDDIIFFDNFDDEITPESIIALKEEYEHCEVRVVEEREQKNGVKVQLRVSGV